ncbi:fumarate reductase/succinate dehydrogenase flavoprotein-like protein [Thermothelomyces heterothallicus CBS 202.75]|uniref:fumarate reductase/succinate dehydrogenase flavoprotein-like protein n=1 Tax=Thermothelomyces heterothallicus CBS 202.75 TaxID=1149848 RepID=UPI00374221F0
MQHLVRVGVSLGFLAATAATAATAAAATIGGKCTNTIVRDVAVIGGGASGAHAAVWLRDNGYSVVVVEKADRLGGHTNFYRDPVTGKDINVGVQAWMEYKDSFEFPKRMNVSTSGSMSFTPNTAQYIDFTTGLPVAGYKAPATEEMYAALQRYLDVLEKYEDMVLPGFFNFPEPGAIPEDLLMPFGEFVAKYNLEAAVPQIWDSTAQGLGDTMNVPTLWVIQASGVPMVRALLGQAAAAVPASGRLYDLFGSIADFLADDVLYSSTVVSSTRYDARSPKKGVSLTVRGPGGKLTCVEAKRLLVSIEPTLANMAPFDLDPSELTILSKFQYTTVYAGILRHPALQTLNAYTGRTTGAASLNYTAFPVAPQVGRIDYVGDTQDLFQFTAVGTAADTSKIMQALLSGSIDAMIAAGTLPAAPSGSSVDYAIFADHGPMHARVSAADLRAGFIQQLYSLQGRRNTFYTGAAFSAGFSTVLWEFNKVLLPKVVKGL